MERVVEPGCYRGRPWLHRDKLPVGFVHRLRGLVEVPEVLEHLADHLLLGADEEAHDVVAQCVPVLVQEPVHPIPDLVVG